MKDSCKDSGFCAEAWYSKRASDSAMPINEIMRVIYATGVSTDIAEDYLQRSNNNVKIAIVMILLQCSYDEAHKRILQADGFVRKALNKEEDAE